ncbi:SigE family RNA polymerase sigma factor [Nocardioides limicola]|uniref:SigE family RNA polymerase sigma factor n=1 Tax=Nocardioides limicola TaxID=2803368 RepID=UPI00193C28E1|nr:SigE family RNA polymerase sigma factor [Nocardioides sp. DJM-14]
MVEQPRPARRSAVDADAAVTELYAAHWPELVRLAVLLTGETGVGEEVVQDAFIALHRRWSRLDDHGRAAGYLRTSVVNGCRSLLRHRKVVERQLEQARHRLDHQESADAAVLREARRDAVLAALGQLPRRQREVLVLRHYLDLSESEIADTLGVSRGSVKTHASRGAAALRDLLPHTLLEER